MTSASPRNAGPQTVALSFTADAACILAFCTVGRRNHAEPMTLPGVIETSWPFLAGLAVSWLLYRAWRRPTAVRPTGLCVWPTTVAIGMALRAATGEGTAFSFIVVATITTGVLLLGWRAGLAAVAGRRAAGVR